MPEFDDILAGIGGGMAGGAQAQQFYHSQDVKQALAELQAQIRLLTTAANIEGRQNVANTNVAGRQNVAETNVAGRQNVAETNVAGRQAVVDTQQAGATNRNNASIAGRASVADLNRMSREDMFWGGTNPVAWDRNRIAERGQDVTAATATANRGAANWRAGLGARVTQRGQNLTDQRGRDVARSTYLGRPINAFGGSENVDLDFLDPDAAVGDVNFIDPDTTAPPTVPREPPTTRPSTGAAPLPVGPRVAPAPTGTPAQLAPPPVSARESLPMTRKPAPTLLEQLQMTQPAAPASAVPGAVGARSAPGGASATAPQVGQTVILKDGRRVRVTAVNPDGTLKVAPAP